MLEQSLLPLPSSASLSFKKKSWVWKFSHLPEELTTSSIQFNSFQSPMKNTGQRECKNFVLFAILSSMFAHACMLDITKETGMLKIQRNSSKVHPQSYSPLTAVYPSRPFIFYIYNFLKARREAILFLFWSFFFIQHMAVYPCVNIQTQFILFRCSAVFHNMNVPWLLSLLPLQYFLKTIPNSLRTFVFEDFFFLIEKRTLF